MLDRPESIQIYCLYRKSSILPLIHLSIHPSHVLWSETDASSFPSFLFRSNFEFPTVAAASVCFKEKQKDDNRQTSFLSHWIARSNLILLLSSSDLHSLNSKFSYHLQVRIIFLLLSNFFRHWLGLWKKMEPRCFVWTYSQ
jgi:hypothetical protein